MAEICGGKWWAWQGLNLRPLRCQGRATRRFPQKTGVFTCPKSGTGIEQTMFSRKVYRSLTALIAGVLK